MGDKYQEIIEGCLQNRRKSQEALYNALAPKMYGVCLRYVADQDDAGDILQESFIKVFDKLKQYNGTGVFEGWVRRIVVNTALEKLRKKIVVEDLESNPSIQAKVDETDFIAEIGTQELLKIIQGLSPQYRLVFNMYAIEGYSHKEIAAKLKISEGTSKSNLSRARLILQEKVRAYYKIEEKIG